MTQAQARSVAEQAARLSYGRLVAMLAARSGDIAAAEDALSAAFAAALEHWPVRGIPDRPEAWLLTAARRTLGQKRARAVTARAAEPVLTLLGEERNMPHDGIFGDDRLKLLFVCAHPAIDESVQAPLMLQTVLGLDAARIAGSFLMSPAAMGQRLVRAKTKIRDAGIAFVVPDAEQIGARTGTVLAAIYAAYGTGWEDVMGADARRKGLAQEAIWLGRLMVQLLPDDPEAMGLLALMLHCEARRVARRDTEGGFVPLYRQDPAQWSRPMVREAETWLRTAATFAKPGRFQTEAAIQSLHAQSLMTGEALHAPLNRLYDLLVAVAPSLGAQVARAVALADSGAPDRALLLLDQCARQAESYQPWWVARSHALRLSGRRVEAAQAVDIAIGLTEDKAIRRFLAEQTAMDRNIG
ncbi:RNA polymerase sigma factor [Sphingobium algorifonticola]|uniref:RNA polymerase subunit sigma-70 n=1 Tax=Sphingobium algorifonticola TaxID=2008318 RepID=A0A437JCE4_9SPHN|nr:DUF6596 domain-containing protein [Sphingobium algorifonticola]RVT43598.1 RNA polymerase subunit sigma-70 [Sphingobium algorifonticola]